MRKILILWMVFAPVCAVGAPVNLVPNSSAEVVDEKSAMPECWNLWVQNPGAAEGTADGTVAKFGQRSFKVMNRGQGGANVTFLGDIPCEPNTEYTLSVYVKTQNSRNVAVTLGAKDAEGKVITWSLGGSQAVPPTTDWIRVIHSAKTPPNCRFLTPHLVNNGGVTWWDAVQLERGKTATDYVDSEPPALPEVAKKPEPSVNLVPNSNFEEDLEASGWRALNRSGDETGNVAWDSKERRSGRRSLKVEGVTKTREWRSPLIAVNPDATHRLSAWLKAKALEGRSDVFLECYGRWLAPIGRAGYDGGVYAYGDFGWGERYAVIRPEQFPSGTRYVRVVCQVTGTVHARGEAWFDDVSLIMSPCTITLRPVRPEGAAARCIFMPDEEVRYGMRVNVPGFAGKPLTARVVIKDYFGQDQRRLEVSFTCDEKSNAELGLNAGKTKGTGYFLLAVDVLDGNRLLGSESASFGVQSFDLKAWKPDESSPFGICHLRSDEEFRLAQIAGMKWHRGGPNPAWNWVEPKQGQWTWEAFDRALESERAFGIHKLIILSGIPQWASREPDEFFVFFRRQANKRFMRPPQNMADWENYVYQTVSRYKDRLKYWEIWNEADIDFWHGTDEEYIDLMKAAYRGAKRADKNCLVSMTGLAYPFPTKTRTGRLADGRLFLEKCLRLAPNEFDIINFHSYGGVPPLERKIREVAELKRQYRCTKPVWITETGMPTHLTGSTEQQQAQYLLQAYTLSLAGGVEKVFWHCFYDWGLDPNYNEHHFGLVHNDYSPKPAYMAYCAMTRKLAGAAPKGELTLDNPETDASGGRVRGVVFERMGQPITVLWSESQPQAVLLRLDRDVCQLTDIMGNSRPLSAPKGLALMTLAPEGVYLEGARVLSRVCNLVRIEDGVQMKPGESRTLRVTLHNPLDTLLSGQCVWICPEGFQANPTTTPFEMEAGATHTKEVKFNVPQQMQTGRAEVFCDLNLGGQPLKGLWAGRISFMVPLNPPRKNIVVDGQLSEWSKEGVLVLDSDSRVVQGRREGSADLSGTLTAACDDEALYLGIDVKDNWVGNCRRYDQPWIGDAVEVFLDLRRNSDLRRSAWTEGVFQFFFIPSDERTAQPTWLLWQSKSPFAPEIECAGRRTPEGYCLEARIPWRNFGSWAPAPNSVIGLDWGMDDVDDASATTRKTQMMWAGTERNFVDASTFASGLVGAGASGTPAPIPRNNLLPNPSFEVDVNGDGDFDVRDGWRHMAADWKDTTGVWLWDREMAHSGRCSISIRGVTTMLTWESIAIPVAHDKAYHASVWVRTQGLGDGSARLYVACFSAEGKWVGNAATSEAITGTTEWQKLEVAVPLGKLPKDTTIVRVNLALRGPTEGAVWFDDADFRVAD